MGDKNNRIITILRIGLLVTGLSGLVVCAYQFIIPSSLDTRLLLFSLTGLISAAALYISLFYLKDTHKSWQFIRRISSFLWASISSSGLLLLCLTSAVLFLPEKQLGMPLSWGIYLQRFSPHLYWLIVICVFVVPTALYFYFLKTREDSPEKTETSRKGRAIPYLLLAAFLLANLVNFLKSPGAMIGGDSDDYLHMAGVPLLYPEFYAGTRPPFTGFVYKFFGANMSILEMGENGDILNGYAPTERIRIFQYLFHTLCWGRLGLTAGRTLRFKYLKHILTALIFLTALSPAVRHWNDVILSESISISLMALLLALAIGLARKWRWLNFYMLILVTFCWINTRETNALLVLTTIPFILAGGVLKRNIRIPMLYLASLLVVAYLITSHFSEMRNRWVIPFINVVYQRILPDEGALKEFIDMGMPVGDDVLAMEGQWACSDNCAVYKVEKFSTFWEWSRQNGKITYAKYLIKHPIQSLAEAASHLDILLVTYPPGSGKTLPDVSSAWSVLYFEGIEWVMLVLSFGLCAFLIIRWWRDGRRGGMVPLLAVFAFTLLPHLFLGYHGDAMEIERHSILASIQLRVLFYMVLVFALDRIVATALQHVPDF